MAGAAVRPGHRRRRAARPAAPSTTRARSSTRSRPPGGSWGPTGRLPVNLKFLVEGEEEVGSAHFEAAARRRSPSCWPATSIVVSDTGMIAPDVPSATVGMRGLVAFDVALRTADHRPPQRDVGRHGAQRGAGSRPGSSPPCTTTAAGSRSPASTTRCGPCRPPSRRPSTLSPSTRRRSGPRAASVPSSRARPGTRPSSASGCGPPPRSSASTAGTAARGSRPSSRPRPGSRWRCGWSPTSSRPTIAAAFEAWLASVVPDGVEVTVTARGRRGPGPHPGRPPGGRCAQPGHRAGVGHGARSSPGRAAADRRRRSAGSWTPRCCSSASGLPDDRIHAPNERMVMDQFWKGLLAAGELLVELGAVVEVGAAS